MSEKKADREIQKKEAQSEYLAGLLNAKYEIKEAIIKSGKGDSNA